MVRNRIRIRFTKQDDLRLISHRDLARTWERLFRRADLRLSMSEGFHPKPRMNFPSALGLGIVGLDEVLEIDLAEERSCESVVAAIVPQAPAGLLVKSVQSVAQSAKARVRAASFQLAIPSPRRPALTERIDWLLGQESFCIQRPDRPAPLDVRCLIESLALVEGELQMTLRADRDGSARPREVLAALDVADVEGQSTPLVRTRVELQP